MRTQRWCGSDPSPVWISLNVPPFFPPLPYPLHFSPFATWVSWSTLCARLSRTFIVAVEQRQPGSSSAAPRIYILLCPHRAQSCVSLCFPPPPPWHSYNCRIQCTHTHWMLYSFSLCLRLRLRLLLLLLLLYLCASALAFVTCACECLKYLCWLSMHLREYAEVELLIYQQRVCECACALVCDLCIVIHIDSRQIPR